MEQTHHGNQMLIDSPTAAQIAGRRFRRGIVMAICLCLTTVCVAQDEGDLRRSFENLRLQRALKQVTPLIGLEREQGIVDAIEHDAHFLPRCKPLAPEVRAKLVSTMARFVYLRLGSERSGEYWDWRTSSGATPYTLEELEVVLDLPKFDWAAWLGEPDCVPDPRRCFVHASENTFARASGRPIAIAASSAGMVCEIWTDTTGDADVAELHGTELPIEIWLGSRASGAGCYWRLPHEPDSLLTEFGSRTFAQLGVIVQFANGQFAPLSVRFLWDPCESQWYPVAFGNGNSVGDTRIMVW